MNSTIISRLIILALLALHLSTPVICLGAAPTSGKPFNSSPVLSRGGPYSPPTSADIRSTGDYHNVSLLGRWANGPSFATAAIGEVAYFADGAILRIIDYSVPGAPDPIGELTLPGPIFDIQIVGNYAYIANYDDGLRVVDISNPAEPVEVGFFDTAGQSYKIAIAGDFAFVADAENGLCIIDISDSAAPSQVGNVPTDRTTLAVAAIGNQAYYAGYWGDLHILDVTNPTSPSETSVFNLSGDSYDMTVSGNYVYVAHDQILSVVDVTDPAIPVLADNELLDGVATSVVVSGEYAFVGASSGGLEILQFTTSPPATLTEIAVFDTEGYASDVAVGGDFAFVSDRHEGLRIIDISMLASPFEAGQFETAGQIHSVAVAQNLAFLGDRERGLHIIDFLNRSQPVRIGHLNTSGTMLDVVVRGNYAYIADYDQGLRVIDISTPTAPFEAGSLPISHYANYVVIRGDRAYVSEAHSGLRIVDISTPTAPTTLSTIDPAAGSVHRAVVNDTHVFVAKAAHGISVIDITNPLLPEEVGSFDPVDFSASIWGLDIAGDYAYLADHAEDNLYIVDISDPAAPSQVNIVATEFRPEDIVIHDGFAFVACYNAGLRVFDLAVPTAPVEVGFYDTGDQAYSCTVTGTTVLVADDQDGLWVLDNMLGTPVYLSSFSLIDLGGAAALSWELPGIVADTQFRLLRRQEGMDVEVGWSLDSPGHYSAVDADVLLRKGGRFEYRLHGREPGGMWRLLRSESIELNPSPRADVMLSVCPNPFNPLTTITFSIDQPQQVRLSLYDLAGSRIAVIADRQFSSGAHSCQWNGCDVSGQPTAAGTYLVRLETVAGVSSQKVMLIR